eukprot:CCRYP_014932-RB/>CCRYP_014932-RB protein AED:0.07 eAED:0.07 QI:215/0.81/0.75/1/0.63/0.58/12/3112/737
MSRSENHSGRCGLSAGSKQLTSDRSEDERQLKEFNEWLVRWNDYQDQLAKYWSARALEAQRKNTLLRPVGGVASATPMSPDRWELRFQELCEYKREYGDCNVPSSFAYRYKPSLGAWVKRMRGLHNAGKLDHEKVMRLSQIGFDFFPSDTPTIKSSVRWNASFRHLKSYKDKHGNLEVPNGYRPVPGGKQLDQWILRQRRLFKEDKLPVELIKKLEMLGLNLKGRGRPFGYESSESWEQSYHELSKYHEKFGHTDVPEVFQSNLSLGVWVKKQRKLYKMGALHQDRVQKLSEIGFLFHRKENASSITPWETRVSELKAFKDANGHVDVPKSYALNLSLGIWIRNQRLAYSEGKLSENQVKILNDLGFDFTVKSRRSKPLKLWERNFHELVKHKERFGKFRRLLEVGVTFQDARTRKVPCNASWEAQYEALLEYKSEHGDINVPSVYPPNQSLYYWICTQRAYFRKSKLSAERLQLLHAIGFDFSQKEEAPKKEKGFLDPIEFNSYVEKLVAYKVKYGDTNVPQRYEANRLGSFVHYMRHYNKTGKLSADQVVRLKEISFDFNVQDSLWNSRCDELASYKEQHGDFCIPYAEYPVRLTKALHQWKNNQIRRHKKNSLTEDQRDKLTGIGFHFVEGPPKTVNPKKTPMKTTTPVPREPPIGLRVESDPAKREQYLNALWDANYEKCVALVKETGNCDIPLKYAADPSLGAWCFAQRMAFKKNKLSEDRRSKLLGLGFKF